MKIEFESVQIMSRFEQFAFMTHLSKAVLFLSQTQCVFCIEKQRKRMTFETFASDCALIAFFL